MGYLTKTAWVSVPSHSLPIAPIQGVSPDTYLSNCSKSAYLKIKFWLNDSLNTIITTVQILQNTVKLNIHSFDSVSDDWPRHASLRYIYLLVFQCRRFIGTKIMFNIVIVAIYCSIAEVCLGTQTRSVEFHHRLGMLDVNGHAGNGIEIEERRADAVAWKWTVIFWVI